MFRLSTERRLTIMMMFLRAQMIQMMNLGNFCVIFAEPVAVCSSLAWASYATRRGEQTQFTREASNPARHSEHYPRAREASNPTRHSEQGLVTREASFPTRHSELSQNPELCTVCELFRIESREMTLGQFLGLLIMFIIICNDDT